MWAEGFDPILSPTTQILILGSMPSQSSLSAHQYYAHPRNAFWPIMRHLLDIPANANYEESKKVLELNGIGVWDVYAACFREGSLDSAIDKRTALTNNFTHLLAKYPFIHGIFFNGKAAQLAYIKHVIPQLSANHYCYYLMPSTSPANAAITVDEKLQQWKKLIEVLRGTT